MNGSELYALIQRGLSAAQQLGQLLEQEQALLRSGNPTALQQLAQQKLQVLEEIETTTQQRQQLLDQAQLPTTADGITSYIKSCAPELQQPLRQAWQQLNEHLHQCHQQNLVNGKVIAGSANSVHRLLGIIQGQDPSTQLYGPQGQVSTARTSQRSSKV